MNKVFEDFLVNCKRIWSLYVWSMLVIMLIQYLSIAHLRKRSFPVIFLLD